MKCPVCGSLTVRRTTDSRRHGVLVVLLECRACGHHAESTVEYLKHPKT